MTPFDLLKLAAATWYLSYALVSTHGVFGMFDKLREFKGGRWHGRIKSPEYVVSFHENTSYETTGLMGGEIIHQGLLDCIICTSIWVALALLLIGSNVVTDALAVAGFALWVHGFTSWRINM